MNSTAADKARLRPELRRRRLDISPAERRHAARRAAKHLMRSAVLRRARRVALYLPRGSELDTRPLIRALRVAGKQLLVPQLHPLRSGLMQMVGLRRQAALGQTARCIPATNRVRPARALPDLVIAPLLGFDDCGRRLGQGGGYYDRWFARHPHARPRIGYAYAAQRVDAVPADARDIRLDAVCTEHGIVYFYGLRTGRRR